MPPISSLSCATEVALAIGAVMPGRWASQDSATCAGVAPAFCADAIMEAADAGIRLICSITDGIPAQDMMRVKRYLMRYPKDRRPMMVGPNCAGIISPGKCNIGITAGEIAKAMELDAPYR